jgi:type IV pilus assembly protein PilM
MLFGGKKFLGLDLGSNSLKMAELEVTRKSATLLSFGFAPTPENSIQGGEVMDIAKLATAVSALHSELATKRKNTVTGMWGGSVIVKRITMPLVDDKLLAEQVRWEAEQYIPFDINEVSLEFQKLPQKPDADTMDVVAVAAKSDLVYKYVEVVQGAGLECAVLDVSGFALANCFEFNYGRLPGQIALINIGCTVTNFVILEEGHIVFTRDIPAGGLNYNSDIQNEMNVSAEEAEALKIGAALGQPVPVDVQRIVTNSTEHIAKEIHSTLDFYAATTANAGITQIFVCGGTSGFMILKDALAQKLGVPVEPLNPFINVKYSSRKFTPDFIEQIKPFAAVAIGLALRKGND